MDRQKLVVLTLALTFTVRGQWTIRDQVINHACSSPLQTDLCIRDGCGPLRSLFDAQDCDMLMAFTDSETQLFRDWAPLWLPGKLVSSSSARPIHHRGA
jgi:hypothetical protein